MFSQVNVAYVIVLDSHLQILTIPGIFLFKKIPAKLNKTPNTQTKTGTPINQLVK